MTLLSPFMTSTGIFCFVPISQRLVESGIIPESNSWQFRRLPSVLAPTFYTRIEDRLQFLLPADEVGNAWSEAEVSVLLVVAATREQVKRAGASPNAISCSYLAMLCGRYVHYRPTTGDATRGRIER